MKQIYRVEVRDVLTGATRMDWGNAIVSCVGLLDVPYYPKDLESVQTKFKGTHLHSARWDHSVDFHGKRVAVIGNGCSGYVVHLI